jgi:hypothetical protein
MKFSRKRTKSVRLLPRVPELVFRACPSSTVTLSLSVYCLQNDPSLDDQNNMRHRYAETFPTSHPLTKIPQIGPANVKNTRKNYCSCRASVWYFHCYYSYVEVVFWIFLAHPLFNAPTHNHKPQLGPQHVFAMTKCDKNGIPYAWVNAEYCILPESSCKWSISISHLCLCVAVADLWFVVCDGPDVERVFCVARHKLVFL